MNVVRQDVDKLNAILKVELTPSDYQSKVKSSLEKYRKTAKIPGFRPGTVPMGMIQKQYGRPVLAEELNKLVNDALYSYIQTNQLNILGNPIPKDGSEVIGDFNAPENFTFEYEIGFSPEIEVALSGKSKYDYVKVKIDKSLLDKQVDDLTRRYGKLISAEKITGNDLLLVQFVELNADKSIMEGGIMHSSTISLEFLNDEKTKKEFAGKVVGDKVIVDPRNVSRGGNDTASMLGIKDDQLDSISDLFQVTINEIKHMEAAELNQELFDKLFGEGVVTSEAELRNRVEADLERMFANDSDRLLTKTIYTDLLENTKVQLPDTFLKRWIKSSNKTDISMEQIEQDYAAYSKSLKWQLIQSDIFKKNDIRLDNAEVLQFTKGLLVNNYAQYGLPAPEDKELTASAMQVLQNQTEANQIYDMFAEQKLTEYFKNTVNLKDKELSYDAFVEFASK
ncbi:MAG: trigger factor [Bacteroidota bacterium]